MARHYSLIAPKFQEKPITANIKLCSSCKKEKPAEDFGRDKYKKSGLKSACRSCTKQYHKEYSEEYRKINREKLKDNTLWYDRKSSYGLTKEDYYELLSKQLGVCAICKESPKDIIRMHVDHCHSTGKVRGLLCRTCNQGIGFFKDSVAKLRNAACYLENHNG